MLTVTRHGQSDACSVQDLTSKNVPSLVSLVHPSSLSLLVADAITRWDRINHPSKSDAGTILQPTYLHAPSQFHPIPEFKASQIGLLGHSHGGGRAGERLR